MADSPFAIDWTPTAQRALARLPEKVATAVIEFSYGRLAANPTRAGKPLRRRLEGLHRARRGDYRVIYVVDDGRKVVTVVHVAHRADAYGSR